MPPTTRRNKRNAPAPAQGIAKRLHVSIPPEIHDANTGPIHFVRGNSFRKSSSLTSTGSQRSSDDHSVQSSHGGKIVVTNGRQFQKGNPEGSGSSPQQVVCRVNFVSLESVSLEEKTFKFEAYVYCTTRRVEGSDGQIYIESMSQAFSEHHEHRLNFSSTASDELTPTAAVSPSRPYVAKRPLWRPEFLQTLDAKDKKWTSEDEKCVAFSDGTHAWRRHLTLKVASPMELKSFPFDGQLLKINLTFDADDTVLEIDQDLCQASLMQGATMLLNDEYYVGEPEFDIVLFDPEASGSMSGKSYWHLIWKVPVVRKTHYYMLNAFLPLFIIVASSWTVFTLPKKEKYAERLTILVSLLLTLIALKFSLTSMLPKLSYLTVLDLYFMGGYCALSITIAEVSFVHLDLCDGGDFLRAVCTYIPDDERFGRLVVVIYVYNFIKPLLLAEYWTLKAALSVRFKPENLPCFDDIYINWKPPVSRTWKDIGMKSFESLSVACLFWSSWYPFHFSKGAIPMSLLFGFWIIKSWFSSIDQSFSRRKNNE